MAKPIFAIHPSKIPYELRCEYNHINHTIRFGYGRAWVDVTEEFIYNAPDDIYEMILYRLKNEHYHCVANEIKRTEITEFMPEEFYKQSVLMKDKVNNEVPNALKQHNDQSIEWDF
jgi:hypothetical protein